MYHIAFRALLGVSLFAATLAPAAAQTAPSGLFAGPSGSYQQSCTNIHVSGDQLSARCTSPQGARIRSSIALGGCRGGDIANSNGRLVCNAGYGNGYQHRSGDSMGFGGAAPGGSYQQSCRSVHAQGSMLTATCPDGNGNLSTSSIDPRQCRGIDIENRNGRLTCP